MAPQSFWRLRRCRRSGSAWRTGLRMTRVSTWPAPSSETWTNSPRGSPAWEVALSVCSNPRSDGARRREVLRGDPEGRQHLPAAGGGGGVAVTAPGFPPAVLPPVARAQRRPNSRPGGPPGPRYRHRALSRCHRRPDAGDAPPSRAERVVAELTAVAVALSGGVFFAEHLEPDSTNVERMYRRLFQAVAALILILLEEK